MKVGELKRLIQDSGLEDKDEVIICVGPEEERESYRDSLAQVGFGTPKPGQRKNRRYLLIGEDW